MELPVASLLAATESPTVLMPPNVHGPFGVRR
jgi:hypothetical protein